MRLGDVVRINPESIPKAFRHSQIEYIDISSVGTGSLSRTTRYEAANAPARARRLVRDGDTILATVRPNLRSFLYIKDPRPNLVVSTGFAVLRPRENIDPKFLYYTIAGQAFTDCLVSRVKGAAYPAVDVETIADAEISLPPLPIQRRISQILSTYDDLIENNLRRISLLEEMAQAIYRAWFVEFRYPGRGSEPLVESEAGLIPRNWEAGPIGSLVETMGGGTPSTSKLEYWENGSITWYTPSDLTASNAMFITSSSRKITELGLRSSSAKLFPPYSVMMTSRATIGVVSIATTEACTNQGFITCIPNDRVSSYHLYFWLLDNRQMITSLASGATFKEINKTVFRQLPIAVPPKGLAEAFMRVVSPVAGLVEVLLKQNVALHHTRDLLLPRLISGELDVSDIAISTVEDNL